MSALVIVVYANMLGSTNPISVSQSLIISFRVLVSNGAVDILSTAGLVDLNCSIIAISWVLSTPSCIAVYAMLKLSQFSLAMSAAVVVKLVLEVMLSTNPLLYVVFPADLVGIKLSQIDISCALALITSSLSIGCSI